MYAYLWKNTEYSEVCSFPGFANTMCPFNKWAAKCGLVRFFIKQPLVLNFIMSRWICSPCSPSIYWNDYWKYVLSMAFCSSFCNNSFPKPQSVGHILKFVVILCHCITAFVLLSITGNSVHSLIYSWTDNNTRLNLSLRQILEEISETLESCRLLVKKAVTDYFTRANVQ